jgi:hypothetical protein
MMSDPEKKQEKRFWIVDPSMFNSKNRRSRKDRIRDPVVSIARTIFVISLFTYPLVIVYLGLAYGAIAFWGSLSLSFLALGLFLWKTGYAKNFDSWNPNLGKQLIGIFLAFLAVLGVYEGLFHLGLWILPIMAAGSIAILAIVLGRE